MLRASLVRPVRATASAGLTFRTSSRLGTQSIAQHGMKARSVLNSPLKGKCVQSAERRGYATSPAPSEIPPPPPGASIPPPPPPPPPKKPKKSIPVRLLTPILIATLLFYGVSVPLGFMSLRYRDFLVETVPLGEQLGDLLDKYELSSSAAKDHSSHSAGSGSGSGVGGSGGATPPLKSKETELTRYAESRAKAEGWQIKKPEKVDPAQVSLANEAEKERQAAAAAAAAAANSKSTTSKSTIAKESKKVQQVAADAKDKAGSKASGIVNSAEGQGQKALEEGRKGLEAGKAVVNRVETKAVSAARAAESKASEAAHLVQAKVKEGARKLESEVEGAVDNVDHAIKQVAPSPAPSTLPIFAQKPRELDATPLPPKRANNEAYTGPPLPIGFEPAPGYEVRRAPSSSPAKGDIKPVARPPPPLPLVAPSVKDLASSEPILGELALTIDSLAKFVENNTDTVSSSAGSVLNTAQGDIKKLAERLEAIKKAESEKLETSLKKQANDYSGMLLKAEKDLIDRLDTQEEDWKKAFDDERKNLVTAYKEKLNKELETQQDIINQRLREEVIAQGIELQRRWVSEVKVRVEQERGGRLAKLEELEGGIRKLEKVTKENEEVIGEAVRARKVFAAVKAVEHKVETGAPFGEELRALKRIVGDASGDSNSSANLIALALSTVPEELAASGIASFPALASRFSLAVAPQLQRVSLLPEHGGIIAYLSSILLSSFMFKKEGWAEGEDVFSVVARANFWLANKDLDMAAREVNQLKGWPKALAKDWLNAARKHLEVQQALMVAEVEATAETLKAI